MRIVSLLPSATEIVFALGLGDDLVGVSFECNHPPAARTKPVVCGTSLPTDEPMTAAEIDAAVVEKVAAGEALYELDTRRIREARPELILAQDLCRVCAVPSGEVEDALAVLDCSAEVLSLDPHRLDDVIGCLLTVGAATGREDEARALVDALGARVDAVRTSVVGRSRPRALALEWSDPPFSGGHWVPDMIDAAGGEPVLAAAGEHSVRLDWGDVAASRADVVLFMPCGYDLAAAVREGADVLAVDALRDVPQVWALAGDEYFSRPGPRVVDGVEILAGILHPDAAGAPHESRAVRLR